MARYTVNALVDDPDRYVVEELHGERIGLFTCSLAIALIGAVWFTLTRWGFAGAKR